MQTKLAFTAFKSLLEAKHSGTAYVPPERMLTLDPGETTGWALFEQGELVDAGQIATKELGYGSMVDLFNRTQPTMVVYENYRIYSNKFDRHAFSEVYTLRLIGGIELLCDVMFRIPRYSQMAVQAKGFVTDEKLKVWGYWSSAPKHGRDAIRHGIFWLLFGKVEEPLWELS